MTENRKHDFSGPFSACRGCGRYVEECLEHRYCTPREDRYECECARCGDHYVGAKRSSLCPQCRHESTPREIDT